MVDAGGRQPVTMVVTGVLVGSNVDAALLFTLHFTPVLILTPQEFNPYPANLDYMVSSE
jgi:hypothetical protein